MIPCQGRQGRPHRPLRTGRRGDPTRVSPTAKPSPASDCRPPRISPRCSTSTPTRCCARCVSYAMKVCLSSGAAAGSRFQSGSRSTSVIRSNTFSAGTSTACRRGSSISFHASPSPVAALTGNQDETCALVTAGRRLIRLSARHRDPAANSLACRSPRRLQSGGLLPPVTGWHACRVQRVLPGTRLVHARHRQHRREQRAADRLSRRGTPDLCAVVARRHQDRLSGPARRRPQHRKPLHPRRRDREPGPDHRPRAILGVPARVGADIYHATATACSSSYPGILRDGRTSTCGRCP